MILGITSAEYEKVKQRVEGVLTFHQLLRFNQWLPPYFRLLSAASALKCLPTTISASTLGLKGAL